jgi:hypothetical protein
LRRLFTLLLSRLFGFAFFAVLFLTLFQQALDLGFYLLFILLNVF